MKEQIKDLVDMLNYYTKLYDIGKPAISDKEWDDLYFQLQEMEHELDFYYQDSPTRVVNYQVVNKLQKVTHNHKMLSLDKTKSLDDVKDFSEGKMMAVMPKLDGLTCSLIYRNGKLVAAETRGDGVIGEDVLHNALTVFSIPHKITYTDELIIDGEIVCLNKDFEKFEDEYKNSRSFASGSIRLLDASECAQRNLTFIAWEVIKGFDVNFYYTFFDKMLLLERLGFIVVPINLHDKNTINDEVVDHMKEVAKLKSLPIDGLVFKFNDIAYGKSKGETSHHLKNAIAYKFYDEEYPTILRDIEWSMGRTGVLTPVAIFDPVDIDGTSVSRANLHNISILHDTLGKKPYKGQKIKVYKANMIIPQIGWADKDSITMEENVLYPPEICPICGLLLTGYSNNDSLFLYCQNQDCDGKFINRLKHYCSKKGLDIKGLSSATLEKLVTWGWVDNIIDLYSLSEHRDEWTEIPGFGPKSVDNILQSIEDSKDCTLDAFLSSLGIPLIGRSVSKELIKHFATYDEFRKAIIDNYNFSELDGFAESKTTALLRFNYNEADKLAKILRIKEVEQQENDLPLEGKKYVITGTVKQFKNRDQLKAYIEERGGKVVSAISKNVDYLINNNAASTSAKNVAAKRMGIPILSEAEFLEELN